MERIPYGKQSIDESDMHAVTQVLKSDWLTQGPAVPAFEEAVKAYCAVPYATAVCNATAGLHLACLALGLGQGDILWTSPITFVATANCARYCGAQVDFVDIDPRSYNMSVEALARKLEAAQRTHTLPKIVVPVHFAGRPCDMERIHELSLQYHFHIIEDAAHAIGAQYRGHNIGGSHYADCTVFSFHPVKVMTTAEGGMVTTRHHALDEKIKSLRSHGITRDPCMMTAPSEGPWYYQQIDLGYNYRLSDIHAALGVSQLRRLDSFLARRRSLIAQYTHALEGLPVQRPIADETQVMSAWHLYVVALRLHELHSTRRQVVEALHRANIMVQIHYIPVHLQPYYRQFGFAKGDFPAAEHYYEAALSLPLFPDLTDAEQKHVVTVLRDTLR